MKEFILLIEESLGSNDKEVISKARALLDRIEVTYKMDQRTLDTVRGQRDDAMERVEELEREVKRLKSRLSEVGLA